MQYTMLITFKTGPGFDWESLEDMIKAAVLRRGGEWLDFKRAYPPEGTPLGPEDVVIEGQCPECGHPMNIHRPKMNGAKAACDNCQCGWAEPA